MIVREAHMSEYYIVKIDVAKKQEYIYKSNKIKVIQGGTFAIKFVTEFLGCKILKKLVEKGTLPEKAAQYFNVFNPEGCILFDKGGQSEYIFSEESHSEAFLQGFHEYAFKLFPELNCLVIKEKFDIDGKDYKKIERSMDKALFRVKHAPQNFGQISFGLTERCKNTGGIAGYQNRFGEKLSADAYVRETFYEVVRRSFDVEERNPKGTSDQSVIEALKENTYLKTNFSETDTSSDGKIVAHLIELEAWIKEFAKIVEKSNGITPDAIDLAMKNGIKVTTDIDTYMENQNNRKHAVLTMDGNGMGKFLTKFKTMFFKHDDIGESDCEHENANDAEHKALINIYKEKYDRDLKTRNLNYFLMKQILSISIEETIDNSMAHMVNSCLTAIKDNNETFLANRILVSAGDDITMLMGGSNFTDDTMGLIYDFGEHRIMDKKYIENIIENDASFNSININEFKDYTNVYLDQEFVQTKRLYFSAGITLIDSKYPLYRAVQRAEHLQGDCKKELSTMESINHEVEASLMQFKMYQGDIADTKDTDELKDQLYVVRSNNAFDSINTKMMFIRIDLKGLTSADARVRYDIIVNDEQKDEYREFSILDYKTFDDTRALIEKDHLCSIYNALKKEISSYSSVMEMLEAFNKGHNFGMTYFKTHNNKLLKSLNIEFDAKNAVNGTKDIAYQRIQDALTLIKFEGVENK